HTYSGKGLPYPPFPISPRISNLLTPLTQFCEPPRHLTWVADQCVAGLIKTLDDVRREMELLPDLPYRLHTYLCNHLEENLTIDSVAHALSMNRKQLRQVAKQQFGRTFKDYLTHLRIERAKALLADAS